MCFSNSHGGNIFIGITDKSKIVGIENLSDEMIKNWINSIKMITNPAIYPEIIIHKIEQKQIAEIIVQEYPVKPVACRGKYLKRIGSSNHAISVEEIADMQIQSINSSFDSFIVDSEISDLDSNLVKKILQRVKNKKQN